MSGILGLDISQSSCGWAVWEDGTERPRFGFWQLGSAFSKPGEACAKFHTLLIELHAVTKFEHLFFEKPLSQQQRGGHSTEASQILNDLAAHAQSFGFAFGLRTVMASEAATWRRDFFGKTPRGTKRATLKDLARERCRQLGFKPRNSDEADALGVLDHGCTVLGITPPWRTKEVLRPMMTALRA